MHERKRRMFELADAFVVLPGGLGTLDETFEIITWKQLGLHDKPIVLVDVAGYWAPLHRAHRAYRRSGFAPRGACGLYRVVPRVEDVLAALAAAPQPQLARRAASSSESPRRIRGPSACAAALVLWSRAGAFSAAKGFDPTWRKSRSRPPSSSSTATR